MKSIFTLFAFVILMGCVSDSRSNAQEFKAVYEGNAGFEMTLELSKQGHLRGETRGQEMWLLRRDGINYFVFPEQDGTKVLDLRIASKLMSDVLPEGFSNEGFPKMQFRNIGEIKINRWIGIGYRLENAVPNSPPTVVISNDPTLLPLRDAMLAQVKASVELNPIAGNAFDAMLDILATGAPIQYAGAELTTFEETSFDPSVFVLPTDAMNEADSKSLMINKGMLPKKRLELPSQP